jgi:TM2 domain-containing membrane protein YozV
MSQGSGGNVIAALCSFFLPGLGQLTQGRFLKAVWHAALAGLLFVLGGFGVIPLFFLMNLWSCYEAARWRPPG